MRLSWISCVATSPTGAPMVADPSKAKVAADLEDEEFVAGCENGQWRVLSFD